MTQKFRRLAASVLSAAALSIPLTVMSIPAEAASYHYDNCTDLRKDFKHGVGKNSAKDKVSGKSKPVKNFKKSTNIYTKAIKWNSDLDRDKDKVACEQH